MHFTLAVCHPMKVLTDGITSIYEPRFLPETAQICPIPEIFTLTLMPPTQPRVSNPANHAFPRH
jgi:hypothetical protein